MREKKLQKYWRETICSNYITLYFTKENEVTRYVHIIRTIENVNFFYLIIALQPSKATNPLSRGNQRHALSSKKMKHKNNAEQFHYLCRSVGGETNGT